MGVIDDLKGQDINAMFRMMPASFIAAVALTFQEIMTSGCTCDSCDRIRTSLQSL